MTAPGPVVLYPEPPFKVSIWFVAVPVRSLKVMLWVVLLMIRSSRPSDAPTIELIVKDALGPDRMTTVFTSPKFTSELLFARLVELVKVRSIFAMCTTLETLVSEMSPPVKSPIVPL